MHYIYFLISENRKYTYVGHTDNLKKRLRQHQTGLVHTTRDFGNFTYHILEERGTYIEARKCEKYWKAAAGRKRLKIIYKDIIMASSSNG